MKGVFRVFLGAIFALSCVHVFGYTLYLHHEKQTFTFSSVQGHTIAPSFRTPDFNDDTRTTGIMADNITSTTFWDPAAPLHHLLQLTHRVFYIQQFLLNEKKKNQQFNLRLLSLTVILRVLLLNIIPLLHFLLLQELF